MKKTLLTAIVLIASVIAVTASAITLDMAETTTEYVSEEAVLLSTAVPGYNALTGTKELATFDEADTSYFNTIVPDSTFNGSTKTIFPDSTTNRFCIEHYYWNRYGTLKFTGFTPESGRKYHIVFDEFVEKETALTETWGAFIGNTSGGGNHILHTNRVNIGEGYQHFVADLVSNGTQFALQQRFCSAGGTNGTTIVLYLDNIGFYPYYKVKYFDNDGTELASEWVLLDNDGNLLSEYTPNPALIENKYTEFTTTPGGKKVEKITLDGSDINIYPYSNVLELSADNNVVTASAGNKATVTANTEVEWTVDVGNSGAVYTTTDTSVIITSGNRSGVINVTAKKDDLVKTKEIYLVGGTEYIPGHNAFTGTRDAVSFDDEYGAYANIGTINSQYSAIKISANPRKSTANATDKALNISQADWQRYGEFKPSLTLESGRKYTIMYDEYVVKETAITETFGALLNATDNNENVLLFSNLQGLGTDWQHIGGNFISGSNPLRLQQRFCSANGTNGTPIEIYMDNLAIYPHYKITYIDFDGNVAATEWVLLDDEGKLLTEYIPNLSLVSNLGIEAVSITSGGEEVKTVTLGASDITLYPVEKELTVAVSANVINADEGNTVTITASKDVNWTVDVGASEATYTTTANSATITAKGYSGVVNVTATVGENTKTVSVYLVNGTKFKPGLNAFTGTTESVSFDDEYGAYADIGTINNQYSAMKISDNPKKSTANASDKALNISQADWQRYGEFKPSLTLESGRKYTLMYDEYVAKETEITETFGALLYATDKNENVILFSNLQGFGTDWQHIGGDFISGSNPLRLQQRFCSANGTNGTPIEIYMDNLAIYPHYKVTYMNFDGSVAATDWVLFDTEGKLLTTYAPNISVVPGATGFALTENGEAVKSVALANEDIVLYPVAIAEMLDVVSFRTNTEIKGIRFASFVNESTRKSAVEYGYIVAREDTLVDAGCSVSDLKFETTVSENEGYMTVGETKVTYVNGVAYKKDGENITVDNIYSVNGLEFGEHSKGEGYYFTCVLTGMTEKVHFETTLVVKPYVKIGNMYFYGSAKVTSFFEEMDDACKTHWDKFSENEQAYFNSIYEICGMTRE